MDIATTVEKSANATATVARGVRPDQFDNPTPCGDWTVEELMNHLIGTMEYFAARGEGKPSDPPQPAPRTNYAETVKHLESAASATADAWGRPGAVEQTIDTGAGKMPGSAMATMVASEMLTHGWDLARATGQRMPADDVDVDQVLAGMKQSLTPEARGQGFGPEMQAPRDAPPIDQLAAFLGRKP
jgi:uncharacterized protein (TIGR03086 family)